MKSPGERAKELGYRVAVEGRDPPYGIANATVGEVHAHGGRIISEAEAVAAESRTLGGQADAAREAARDLFFAVCTVLHIDRLAAKLARKGGTPNA